MLQFGLDPFHIWCQYILSSGILPLSSEDALQMVWISHVHKSFATFMHDIKSIVLQLILALLYIHNNIY